MEFLLHRCGPLFRGQYSVVAVFLLVHSPDRAHAAVTPTTGAPWVVSSGMADVQETKDLATAEQLRRSALQSAEEALGPNDKQVALLLSNLGATLRLQGRNEEAYSVVFRALSIAEAAGDKTLTATALNGLGVILLHSPERAEPLLRRSLALFEQTEGNDALHTAEVESNLATLYSNTNRHGRALELMTLALPVYEKRMGEENPKLTAALTNMFIVLSEQGRAEEGEPYLRRAIRISENHSPGAAAMAKLQVCLGALEVSRGNLKESAGHLQSALTLQERALGPVHPEIARTLGYYSAVMRRMHNKSEARKADEHARIISGLVRQ